MVWQWLVRSYLQQAASEKLRETAADVLKEQFADHADAQEADGTPLECDLGIVYALAVELGEFEDRLTDVVKYKGDGFLIRLGMYQGLRIALVEAGTGQTKAAKATAALITGHHPNWVISAGFAGGLTDELKKRHFLMADEIANEQGDKLGIDFRMSPEVLAANPHVHVGRLVTVDKIVRTTAEKRALAEQHAAAAVDMETYAVADVCRYQRVRCMSVRIISDAVGDELPAEVERLLAKESTASRLGVAVGAIMRRPGTVKDLWQLKEDAIVSSTRLATFLEGVVVQLCPPPQPKQPDEEGSNPS